MCIPGKYRSRRGVQCHFYFHNKVNGCIVCSNSLEFSYLTYLTPKFRNLQTEFKDE